mmetsp:Transcript_33880/g.76621  ORF Transcript_33880/g.76621 Transcript_33880/m.76621 type:complete len:312 (-) Transcript_33880:219-1154(-)
MSCRHGVSPVPAPTKTKWRLCPTNDPPEEDPATVETAGPPNQPVGTPPKGPRTRTRCFGWRAKSVGERAPFSYFFTRRSNSICEASLPGSLASAWMGVKGRATHRPSPPTCAATSRCPPRPRAAPQLPVLAAAFGSFESAAWKERSTRFRPAAARAVTSSSTHGPAPSSASMLWPPSSASSKRPCSRTGPTAEAPPPKAGAPPLGVLAAGPPKGWALKAQGATPSPPLRDCPTAAPSEGAPSLSPRPPLETWAPDRGLVLRCPGAGFLNAYPSLATSVRSPGREPSRSRTHTRPPLSLTSCTLCLGSSLGS